MASAVSGILGGIAKAASPIMGGTIGISNAINNALGSRARPKQPTQGTSVLGGALSGLFNPQSYQQKASAMSNALSPLFGSAANNAVAPQIQPQQTPQQQIPTLANAAMQILGQQRGLMQNVPNQIAPINRVIQPMYNVLQAANPLSSLISSNIQNANPLAQALMRLLGRQ